MKTRRGVLVFFFFLAVAVPAAETLDTPSKALAVGHDFANKPLPRYSHGHLLAYDVEQAKVWAYKDGVLKTEADLALPGYSSVRIRGITSSPAGVLAVNASLSDPRLGSASAIVWIAPGGEILRVVGTSPFSASRIAFSADGSLWALGRVHDTHYRNAPRYDMLRQYNAQGELVRTALASDAFGPQPLRTSESRSPARRSRVRARSMPPRYRPGGRRRPTRSACSTGWTAALAGSCRSMQGSWRRPVRSRCCWGATQMRWYSTRGCRACSRGCGRGSLGAGYPAWALGSRSWSRRSGGRPLFSRATSRTVRPEVQASFTSAAARS